MAAAEAALAPFRVGAKEIFLPNFTIALHRTSALPAQFARFTVPLWFSKLDLRDYLYHAYDVRVLGVRSYVRQSRVTSQDAEASRPTPNRWHRPRATKMMTVELERPFVWPAELEDYAAWEQEQKALGDKDTARRQNEMRPTGNALVNETRRERMREQARELLEGRKRWRPASTGGGLGSVGKR